MNIEEQISYKIQFKASTGIEFIITVSESNQPEAIETLERSLHEFITSLEGTAIQEEDSE